MEIVSPPKIHRDAVPVYCINILLNKRLKPGMAVLAKTSSKLTDQPVFCVASIIGHKYNFLTQMCIISHISHCPTDAK
jgi:hypothetical protein